jgi:hypothetical protein
MKTFPSYVCSLDAVLKRYLSVTKIGMQMHRLAVGKLFDLLNENAIQFHKME